MRIATWNIEWFVNLFDARGRLLEDDERSSRYKVSRADQLRGIAHVLRRMDADAIMVIEAPDNNAHRQTGPMLEAFARRFRLRQSKALLGYENTTQQEIALLYDPAKLTARHDPQGVRNAVAKGVAPRFDGHHAVDVDRDGRPDLLTFNKPPLEIAAVTAAGAALRMIGVHLSISAFRWFRSPSGVALSFATTTEPRSAIFCTNAGSAMPAWSAATSLSITGFGVPFGA